MSSNRGDLLDSKQTMRLWDIEAECNGICHRQLVGNCRCEAMNKRRKATLEIHPGSIKPEFDKPTPGLSYRLAKFLEAMCEGVRL